LSVCLSKYSSSSSSSSRQCLEWSNWKHKQTKRWGKNLSQSLSLVWLYQPKGFWASCLNLNVVLVHSVRIWALRLYNLNYLHQNSSIKPAEISKRIVAVFQMNTEFGD
jgi:hypothetical protein